MDDLGGVPSGRCELRCPAAADTIEAPIRTRPLANTSPSGPAISTASSASKRARDLDRRRPAAANARPPRERPPGAVVDDDRARLTRPRTRSTACGPAAAAPGAAPRCRRRARPRPRLGSTPRGARPRDHGPHARPGRDLGRGQLRGHAPAPPRRPGPAGQGLELVVDLDDLLDQRGRRVEPRVGGEQPGGVGEQHEQVGVDAGGPPGRRGGRCRRSGSRRRRWRRSR